jgi:signal transduction histidine kinase
MRPALAPPRNWKIGYGFAIGMVVVATLLRVPLAPLLGNSVPFILYFPALVVVGWFGGFGPGMVATFLSGYAARTYFFEPRGHFDIPDLPSAFRLGLFVLSGSLMSYLCGRLHQRTEELRLEKEGLELKVHERTLHLERALKDMEGFSYTVSHDLRSPLRSMHGFSEILLQDYSGSLDDKARGYLERIRAAATRMDKLVDDLLAFAKVSGAAVETHPLPLKTAVASVIETTPRLNAPGVKIAYDDCVHTVQAHDTLLHQVLQNLLENAAKFVAVGVQPVIRLWSEEHGERVRLWIEDNGIGIAPGDQGKLFKLFQRMQPTSYSGTGIGLATVDRAVSRMNGRVGVESEPGRGSRFWVDLLRA